MDRCGLDSRAPVRAILVAGHWISIKVSISALRMMRGCFLGTCLAQCFESRFYDPKKPTMLYFHGWTGEGGTVLLPSSALFMSRSQRTAKCWHQTPTSLAPQHWSLQEKQQSYDLYRRSLHCLVMMQLPMPQRCAQGDGWTSRCKRLTTR